MEIWWISNIFPIAKSVDGDNPHDETHEDRRIQLAGQKGENNEKKTEA